MNNVNLVCCRMRNKHLSQKISKKFKKAQRIHRKKSRNYKKQKIRRNSFLRQGGKNTIKYDLLEEFSLDDITLEESEYNENNVRKQNPKKLQNKKPLAAAKCQAKLVFVCDQFENDHNLKKHYTIKSTKMKLEISNTNINIGVDFSNDYSEKDSCLYSRGTGMMYLFNDEYYYDYRRMFNGFIDDHWNKKFGKYKELYGDYGAVGLPPMHDFGEDLIGYLFSLYLETGCFWYSDNVMMACRFDYCNNKEDLFDNDYNICSYDINGINDAIIDWFDRISIELHNNGSSGNNGLSNSIYCMLVLQYLFEPIADIGSRNNSNGNNNNNNSNNNNNNNNSCCSDGSRSCSNNSIGSNHSDFVRHQYKHKSWIEFNATCSISSKLFNQIMAYTYEELDFAMKQYISSPHDSGCGQKNVEINVCKNKHERCSFLHLYFIRKLFSQKKCQKILKEFKIRYLG